MGKSADHYLTRIDPQVVAIPRVAEKTSGVQGVCVYRYSAVKISCVFGAFSLLFLYFPEIFFCDNLHKSVLYPYSYFTISLPYTHF